MTFAGATHLNLAASTLSGYHSGLSDELSRIKVLHFNPFHVDLSEDDYYNVHPSVHLKGCGTLHATDAQLRYAEKAIESEQQLLCRT